MIMLNRIHSVALHLFVYLGLVFLMASLIPAGIIIYWLADTEPPLSAITGKFVGWDQNRPNTAIIEWTGIRNRSCPGVAYRYLIGDQVWDLPDRKIYFVGAASQNTGKPMKWIVPMEVPPDAKDSRDGMLKYLATVNYVCNPLQSWFPITIPVEDLVIPNPPQPTPPTN